MDITLIKPDPGLYLWTIITFLVLMGLLRAFAWKPLLLALEERRDTIRKSLDDAQQAKQELERLRVESAEILRQARVEAESIVARSRTDAEKLREEMKHKARSEADNIVKNAEGQIQVATREALRQIRLEAVDISVTIASKLLQRNLTPEDNKKLIDEALKEIASKPS